MPKKFLKRIAVRFVGEVDKRLYESLTKSADRNHRSINGETLKAIEYYLQYATEAQQSEEETKQA